MCQVRVFNDSDQFIGPLFHVDYFSLMDCSWYPRFVFAFLVVILVLFLKSTADEYLSGALTVICEILELSQDVAGATLLALGNGAPDVFSTLAAFTKGSGGSNTDLGVGSLLGGISFVTTVVLGCVILASNEEISVRFETFGRDILFLMTAVILLALSTVIGNGASIGMGILFLTLYFIYVVLVVYQSREFRRQKCWNDDTQADEPLISIEQVTNNIENQQEIERLSSPIRTNDHETISITDNYFPLPTNRNVARPIRIDNDDNVKKSPNASYCASLPVYQNMYWRQLRFRRSAIRYGAKLATELGEMSFIGRMLSVIQFPLGFLRALTVPLPETSSWSRSIVVLQPPFCTAFILYVTSQGTDVFGLLLAILLPISTLISIILFYSVHDSKPPTSNIARLIFALISFFMCVIWIYAVAAEIVALFNSFGTVFNANSSIMGLSFLAWGNSIGDLVTNVAIARGGMAAMGVAACVASPVFNMLFGLGASLTVVSYKQYPNHVPINLDRYTIAAVILLVSVLSLTLVFAKYRAYKLNRAFGIVLLLAYGVYIICMGILTLLNVN